MAYTGSKGLTGLGTLLQIGSTPTTIGEVKSLKLSGRKWDVDDATNFQSTNKEFVAAISDLGEWAVEGTRVAADAGQVALEAAFASGAPTPFVVQLPKASGQSTSGDKYSFSALVQELDYSFEPAKIDAFSCKLKISGAIAFTPGT